MEISNVLKPRPARPVEPETSGTGGKAGPEGRQPGRGSNQHIPGSTRLVKPETVTRNRDPLRFPAKLNIGASLLYSLSARPLALLLDVGLHIFIISC